MASERRSGRYTENLAKRSSNAILIGAGNVDLAREVAEGVVAVIPLAVAGVAVVGAGGVILIDDGEALVAHAGGVVDPGRVERQPAARVVIGVRGELTGDIEARGGGKMRLPVALRLSE